MGVTENQVISRLFDMHDENYKSFSASLIPNIDNVLGIRLPQLRKLAKELHKAGFQGFSTMPAKYMECDMLDGMLIGLSKDSPETILNKTSQFLPRINNWSVCDSFCCGLKFAKENKELVWKFIEPFVTSEREYYVRFALVMMLDYFVEEDYIDEILNLVLKVKHEGYYAKMAVAWLLSVCYVKFPEKTEELLKTQKLDEEVLTKTVRKICESLRVSKEQKIRVKTIIQQ